MSSRDFRFPSGEKPRISVKCLVSRLPGEALKEGAAVGKPTGKVNSPRRNTAINSLWLVDRSDETQRSISVNDRQVAPPPGGALFCFAPGDDAISIAWQVDEAAGTARAKLELARDSAPGTVIWSQEWVGAPVVNMLVDKGAVMAGDVQGALDWGVVQIPLNTAVGADANAFPDRQVTVEHAPYILKMTLTPSRGAVTFATTRFDIAIADIRMFWGAAGLIPGGNRADITALYHADTLAAEQVIVTDLTNAARNADQSINNGVRHSIALPCDQYCTAVADMSNDSLFNKHRNQWGDGPRIPLQALIRIRKRDGSPSVNAPHAIGNTKFLWDWESEPENFAATYPNVTARAFIQASVDYRVNDPGGPPGSTNCHFHRGGKRGAGAVPVFPLQSAGSPPQNPVGPFPFVVNACTNRPWAVLSHARTTGGVNTAGYTGVIFQPSRMAKDTYRVTVYAANEPGGGAPPALDCALTAALLQANHPGTPRYSTGYFDVFRKYRGKYLAKAGACGAIVHGTIGTQFACAGVTIQWAPNPGLPFTQVAYNQLFNDTLNQPPPDPITGAPAPAIRQDRGALITKLRQHYIDGNIDQFTGEAVGVAAAGVGWPITFKSWNDFKRPHLINAVTTYLNKPRKVNTMAVSFAALGLRNRGLAANDLKILFYNSLSVARKAKVDQILRNSLVAANLPDSQAAYELNIKNWFIHLLKEMYQRYITLDAFIGFTFIHMDGVYRLKDGVAAGNFTDTDNGGTGGIGPSDASAAQGRKACYMVFLPVNVPPAWAAAPRGRHVVSPSDIISTHELGHDASLCHAPAAPGAPPAGGFDVNCHDSADMLCLMNYDDTSDHLCGLCLLRLRGWARVANAPITGLSNIGANNRV